MLGRLQSLKTLILQSALSLVKYWQAYSQASVVLSFDMQQDPLMSALRNIQDLGSSRHEKEMLADGCMT